MNDNITHLNILFINNNSSLLILNCKDILKANNEVKPLIFFKLIFNTLTVAIR